MFVAFLYIALILGFSHRVLFLELEADLVLWYTLWRLKRGGDDTNGPQRTPNPSTNHVHSRDSYLRKYSLALTNRRYNIKFNLNTYTYRIICLYRGGLGETAHTITDRDWVKLHSFFIGTRLFKILFLSENHREHHGKFQR